MKEVKKDKLAERETKARERERDEGEGEGERERQENATNESCTNLRMLAKREVEQTRKTQDEPQWIVSQRLLSTLTIPGFN